MGDVGSIVFEHENQVAVVTRIADKVLLAAVGTEKLQNNKQKTIDENAAVGTVGIKADSTDAAAAASTNPAFSSQQSQSAKTTASSSLKPETHQNGNKLLAAQYEIDRESDLARLAALNLNSSPEILLALESKSAALGRFLRQKLQDLETPEDF